MHTSAWISGRTLRGSGSTYAVSPDKISTAKSRAAVNVELVLLYRHIGGRILRDILREQRAAHGRKIVSTVSRELVAEYGPGYSGKNLRRMIRFSTRFHLKNPDDIRAANNRKLWQRNAPGVLSASEL
ncbi:DUF1016 domain-containing protein [Methanoculleus sp. FWC-SCC3]|jgi:hypothetical protein|uniref:DUF1016 domain-containing protein n=1 Tax=Methanoculleus methanifontis TaxID=2584086 RepID=A0ABT8M3Z8_9EURY|nr:DUF1016 domain-containing protein [Methanoculleus sp. FWC-SCC3]